MHMYIVSNVFNAELLWSYVVVVSIISSEDVNLHNYSSTFLTADAYTITIFSKI